MTDYPRPRLAVWKFASCDGCQLSLLDCEDELLALAGTVRIAHFTEMSRASVEGPYDLSLVEGSITTAADAERIQEVRRPSRRLVTIGACATAGGIQGLRNFAADGEYVATVYAHPEYISSLDHLDAHLGPRPRRLRAARVPDRPAPAARGHHRPCWPAASRSSPSHSVCQQCKARGPVCLLVAAGTAVPRSGDPSGLRGSLPPVGPGLLRVLRPVRGRQHQSLAGRLLSQGHGTGRRLPALRHLQRRAPGLPRRSREPGRDGHEARSNDQAEPAMTHGSGPHRTVAVGGLSRVEGEGRCGSSVRDGVVSEVALDIFEPPRFFEAHAGRAATTEAPDITARICGICPVAYQMSACAAMEDACDVTVGERIAALRRLLYCGEWIQSHALHVYLLHAPDFLGCADAVELAERDRASVERGLRLKRAGNLVMETVGGRAVHPVNVRVGGFYRAPDRASRSPLWPNRCAGPSTTPWPPSTGWPASTSPTPTAPTGSSPSDSRAVPDRVRPGRLLRRPRHQPGRVRRPGRRGARGHARRRCTPGSTARPAISPARWPATRSTRTRFPSGPAGRRRGRPRTRLHQPVPEHRRALRWSWSSPATKPSRLIETVRATRSARRRGSGHGPEPAPVRPRPPGASSSTATRSTMPELIRSARIVPPTSQNQLTIEADLRRVAQAGPRPRRRAAHLAVRAGGAQSRSLHLLCRPFPRRDGRADEPCRHETGAPGGRRRPRQRVPARRRRRPGVSRRAGREPAGHGDVGPVVDPLDLLDCWDGAGLAIVVDAVRSGASRAPSGSWSWPRTPPTDRPRRSRPSRASDQHATGSGWPACSRLRPDARRPGAATRVVVVGIEGDDFSQGTGLSRAVEAAVPAAVREVVELIEEVAPCA